MAAPVPGGESDAGWIRRALNTMRRGSLIVILGVVAVTTVGCADKRVTLSYQPSPNLAPIGQPQPLTIRGFNDRRGDETDGDPTRVGGIYGGGGKRHSKGVGGSPFLVNLPPPPAAGVPAPPPAPPP